VDRVVLIYNEFKSVMTQRVVVDQLREDAAVGAVYREAGALGVAAHLGAHATAAAQAVLLLADDGHARLPTFRATCSPE